MVQQQEAEKAIFRMQQAKTDAETLIIKAKADAESIRIQGEALQSAPKLVELKMVEKWNGVAPQVVGSGSNILLPASLSDSKRLRTVSSVRQAASDGTGPTGAPACAFRSARHTVLFPARTSRAMQAGWPKRSTFAEREDKTKYSCQEYWP
jgi:hypothetical protein